MPALDSFQCLFYTVILATFEEIAVQLAFKPVYS